MLTSLINHKECILLRAGACCEKTHIFAVLHRREERNSLIENWHWIDLA
jgi:hypothetical protein